MAGNRIEAEPCNLAISIAHSSHRGERTSCGVKSLSAEYPHSPGLRNRWRHSANVFQVDLRTNKTESVSCVISNESGIQLWLFLPERCGSHCEDLMTRKRATIHNLSKRTTASSVLYRWPRPLHLPASCDPSRHQEKKPKQERIHVADGVALA
jgi:hypothetical protein